MTQLVAITTAAAIAIGSLAAAAPNASAAPFSPAVSKSIETAAPAIEEVGRRGRRNATAAAVGIGAFAAGLAIAAGATNVGPARRCYIERVRTWHPRLQAYVIRKERVCY